jgi:hypothetical protein
MAFSSSQTDRVENWSFRKLALRRYVTRPGVSFNCPLIPMVRERNLGKFHQCLSSKLVATTVYSLSGKLCSTIASAPHLRNV